MLDRRRKKELTEGGEGMNKRWRNERRTQQKRGRRFANDALYQCTRKERNGRNCFAKRSVHKKTCTAILNKQREETEGQKVLLKAELWVKGGAP